MSAGVFITFEGGEGAGKSTQVALLRDKLVAAGRKVVVTREPGGSELAEAIRGLVLSAKTQVTPLTEALLFNAARADHLDKTIRPALASGHWVLCDRFSDSTRVYQAIAGGVAMDDVLALEAMVLAQTRPDLTLVFDLGAEEGLRRAEQRRNAGEIADRFEGRDLSFHDRLSAGFRDIAQAEPDRCVLIDAGADIDGVADQVWAAVSNRVLR